MVSALPERKPTLAPAQDGCLLFAPAFYLSQGKSEGAFMEYEGSPAFICSANKACCTKHIVPSPSNHTTSLNLSTVNEALKQGTTPSHKMCRLQQFCEQFKMQVGGEVAANRPLMRTINQKNLWRACKQALLFLQVAAINHISFLLSPYYWKRQQKCQPLRKVRLWL